MMANFCELLSNAYLEPLEEEGIFFVFYRVGHSRSKIVMRSNELWRLHGQFIDQKEFSFLSESRCNLLYLLLLKFLILCEKRLLSNRFISYL
jgi:hypothetical protein